MAKNRKSLKTPRKAAFQKQKGLCYYCNLPMWLDSQNLPNFIEKYMLTERQANKFRCTGEHLEPHKHGGAASRKNIVAACLFCNSRRHSRKTELAPQQFAKLVRSRVKAGRWTAGLINTSLLQKNPSYHINS